MKVANIKRTILSGELTVYDERPQKHIAGWFDLTPSKTNQLRQSHKRTYLINYPQPSPVESTR